MDLLIVTMSFRRKDPSTLKILKSPMKRPKTSKMQTEALKSNMNERRTFKLFVSVMTVVVVEKFRRMRKKTSVSYPPQLTLALKFIRPNCFLTRFN